MKTISIVGWIADKAAVLEDSPIIARVDITSGAQKNGGAKDGNSGQPQTSRIAKDQSGTSDWLNSLNSSQRSLKPF
jgi:hypothetical protein